MRNLKRVLALALALVMMLGMMITASAATYTDEAAIDADYAEAVEVLTGMGIFKGTGAGFAPKAILTRAEAAALIYRVISADVKDSKIDLYSYSNFADVADGAWYTGYVTYAANGGYIKGYDGNFMPNDSVTGIQVLAIMLRAMGYGQKGEFEGAAWKDGVLTVADDLDMLDNVNVKSLDVPATRELVAQLLWDAVKADTTTYTPAFGYYPTTGASLGEKNFGLAWAASSDEWGRPGIVWYNANKGIAKGMYAIIEEAPLATYTTSVTECQIATDIGLKTVENFVMYTNGKVNASSYDVQPLDTVQRIGSQGTLVEVYEDEIVVISTFLAEVLAVTPVRYDAAGHKAADATISLHVYDADAATQSTVVNMILTSEENYTYAKGDMVLVNSYTNNTPNATTGAVTVNTVATTAVANKPMGNYAEILGIAAAQVGAQTFQWYNAAKHTIDGVNYDDAAELHLDEAVLNTAKYTWYFDQYGNVIGATDIATIYTYGIIEQIQWINPIGTAGYAQATIRYMDGTTAEAVIASVNGDPLVYAQNVTTGFPAVSTNLANNKGLLATDLYRIATLPNGTLALVHVFTDADGDFAYDAAEENEIENAVINPYGAGVNALSAITDGTEVVYANANTVFLIRSVTKTGAYTFEVVTGYQNMAKYNVATIDWVKSNNDSYVDLVYVTGTPASAVAYNGLFFLTSTAGIKIVPNAQGTAVDYYVVSGILDGVTAEYKVDGTVTMAQLEAMLKKLYMVTVQGDEIISVGANAMTEKNNLFAYTSNNPVYTNQALDIHAATTTTGTVTKNGDVLYVDGRYYTVNGMEAPVYGTWADDMSNKTVYVIFDTTKYVALNNGAVKAYVAKAVYVVDGAASGLPSGAGTPSTTGKAILGVNTLNVPDSADNTAAVNAMLKTSANGAYLVTGATSYSNVACDMNEVLFIRYDGTKDVNATLTIVDANGVLKYYDTAAATSNSGAKLFYVQLIDADGDFMYNTGAGSMADTALTVGAYTWTIVTGTTTYTGNFVIGG